MRTAKQAIKKAIPQVVLNAIWAYKTYDSWCAVRYVKDWYEQPRLKRWYEQENSSLPRNKQAIAPNVVINIIDELRPIYKLYAYQDMRFVREMQGFIKYSKNCKCLLDIGAFYADFSLIFTELTGGIAYAVDPSPLVQATMQKVLDANPKHDIRVYQIALGRQHGKLTMVYDRIHCVAAPVKDNSKTVEVEMSTIDEMMAQWNPIPDAVKIDAEGSELDILLGGAKLFRDKAPRIFLEIHPDFLVQRGQSVAKLVETIQECNYEIYHYDGTLVRQPKVFLSKTEGFALHRVICDKHGLVD
ncbi:MAG: FkbM family methyltransferase [Kiritimatiellae bacterium]|nr:FkbM family methyltransferase [Kiritimatiellia bacterium]